MWDQGLHDAFIGETGCLVLRLRRRAPRDHERAGTFEVFHYRAWFVVVGLPTHRSKHALIPMGPLRFLFCLFLLRCIAAGVRS
jgi:hypothetical protein